MINEFGRFMRHLRLDINENLKQMSEKLGVSSAFLSAVEVGKKQVPKDWGRRIIEIYNLSDDVADQLLNAVDISNGKIVIEIDEQNPNIRELSLMFARTINNVEQKTLDELKEILKNNKLEKD